MASYRDQMQQNPQGCFCPYLHYKCPEICRNVDTAVMLITSSVKQEHSLRQCILRIVGFMNVPHRMLSAIFDNRLHRRN